MDYNELEKARLEFLGKLNKNRKLTLRLFGGAVVLILIFAIFLLAHNGKLGDVILMCLIPMAWVTFILVISYAISQIIIYNMEQKPYRAAYKSHFVTETFKQVFTDLTYSHEAAMPKELIESTRMMNMGDVYSSNDYVVAKYNGIPFQQADVHIQKVSSDSDGGTNYETIFRGRWIIFDFNKHFERRLLVEGRQFGCAQISIRDKFQKINLESGEFNKKFRVLAQDGFETYYLLDPAVMERMQRLSDLYNNRIMICFADSKMHIAINNSTDSFEPPSPRRPIDEQAEFNKVLNDIKVITDIVDELKLVKQ